MQTVIGKSQYGYVKPTLVDDWGSLGYFTEAKKSDAGTWSLSSQDESKRLRPGMKVHILWPNSCITLETVKSKTIYNTYTDHGQMQPTTVQTEALFIESSLNGVKVAVPLDSLYVKIAGTGPG